MKAHVKIRNGKPIYQLIDEPPSAALINHVEKLLEQAKIGNARSMISVVQYTDGETSHGYLLDGKAREGSLMGAMFSLMTSISFTHTSHYENLRDKGLYE